MRVCSVPGCNGKHQAKDYCQRHYRQYLYEGGLRKTRFDDNEYTFDKEVCTIKLFDRNGTYKHSTIIDASDYDLVCHHKWHSASYQSGKIYAQTKINRKCVGLHSFLIGNYLNQE